MFSFRTPLALLLVFGIAVPDVLLSFSPPPLLNTRALPVSFPSQALVSRAAAGFTQLFASGPSVSIDVRRSAWGLHPERGSFLLRERGLPEPIAPYILPIWESVALVHHELILWNFVRNLHGTGQEVFAGYIRRATEKDRANLAHLANELPESRISKQTRLRLIASLVHIWGTPGSIMISTRALRESIAFAERMLRRARRQALYEALTLAESQMLDRFLGTLKGDAAPEVLEKLEENTAPGAREESLLELAMEPEWQSDVEASAQSQIAQGRFPSRLLDLLQLFWDANRVTEKDRSILEQARLVLMSWEERPVFTPRSLFGLAGLVLMSASLQSVFGLDGQAPVIGMAVALCRPRLEKMETIYEAIPPVFFRVTKSIVVLHPGLIMLNLFPPAGQVVPLETSRVTAKAAMNRFMAARVAGALRLHTDSPGLPWTRLKRALAFAWGTPGTISLSADALAQRYEEALRMLQYQKRLAFFDRMPLEDWHLLEKLANRIDLEVQGPGGTIKLERTLDGLIGLGLDEALWPKTLRSIRRLIRKNEVAPRSILVVKDLQSAGRLTFDEQKALAQIRNQIVENPRQMVVERNGQDVRLWEQKGTSRIEILNWVSLPMSFGAIAFYGLTGPSSINLSLVSAVAAAIVATFAAGRVASRTRAFLHAA